METLVRNKYKSLLKYTGLFGSVQGLTILISLVRNKLVAVILGPEGMGLISLFNSTVQMVSVATGFGIGTSAVKTLSERYEKNHEEEVRHHIMVIRTCSILAAIVGTLVCAIFGPLFNNLTFSWGDHTLHYVFLSPALALIAITAGETAVLKAVRRLGALARISVYSVTLIVLVTTPLFYFFGQQAIVPSIVFAALSQMLFTVAYSYRLYPLKISFSRKVIGEGTAMVKLGLAFVMAGLFSSAMEFAIRSVLNHVASLDTLGLYNAGYMMTFMCAGLVFSSLEADFFPRLSSVNNNEMKCSLMINRQMEVTFLVIVPLMVAFSVSLPFIVPLLLSHEFSNVIPMVQIAIVAMYVRALKLPAAYLPLAKGDSRSYILLEGYSAVVTFLSVIGGYYLWGLLGIGVGLFLSEMIDCIVIYTFVTVKYHYRASFTSWRKVLVQLPVIILTVWVVLSFQGIWYWMAGILLFLVSLSITAHFFMKTKKG